MEDRELLELAAKAAGIWPSPEPFEHVMSRWNPLEDDDAALGLAIGLRMCVFHWPDYTVTAQCLEGEPAQEKCGSDPYAATRRAIVRAAADLGSRSNAALSGRDSDKDSV